MLMARSDAPIDSFSGPNRRFGARFQPVCREARIASGLNSGGDMTQPEGSESPQQFALLLDISRSGASVVTDRFPRHDRPVWLRLEGHGPRDWSQARVVAVTSTRRGPHVVRIEFNDPCPYDVLRDAITG